ncbi:MAG: hypothetical protein O3C21_04185 [Verrucomicrobia bacterium]|nr:hypothetical protein [Verrucomicrobiota bacterium]
MDLHICTGRRIDQLTKASQEAAYRESIFVAEAGQEYVIRVSGSGGVFRFSLDRLPAPPAGHDRFEARAPLPSLDELFVIDSLEGAEFQAGEPSPNESPVAWHEWTAPADGLKLVRSSPFSAIVFTGDVLESLTRISGSGEALFRATAGVAYKIAVVVPETYSAFKASGFGGTYHLEIGGQPEIGNATFADAVDLESVPSFKVSAHNFSPTEPEEGEPDHKGAPWNSVWWKWTPPVTGVYSIAGKSLKSLRAYHGTSLAELVPLTGWHFVRGKTYYFAAASSAPDVHRLVEFAIEAPTLSSYMVLTPFLLAENDAFADRIDLGSAVPVEIVPPIRNLTQEPGEPTATQLGGSAWWRWTAPADGHYRITGGALVRLYSGDALESLREVQLFQEKAPEEPDRGYFQAKAGERLAIAVYSASNGGSSHWGERFVIEALAVADNDTFAQAHDLGDGNAAFPSASAIEASWDPTEPGGPRPFGTLTWWRWTAPDNGLAALVYENENEIAPYPDVLLHTGMTLETLQPVPFELFGDQVHVHVRWSRARLYPVQKGVQYYISLGRDRGKPPGNEGWQDDPWSPPTLRIEWVPAAANDRWQDAIDLGTGDDFEAWSTTMDASREANEPDSVHPDSSRTRTVWWTWTAPKASRYMVSTSISHWDWNSEGPDIEIFRSEDGGRALVPAVVGYLFKNRLFLRSSEVAGERFWIRASWDWQMPISLFIGRAEFPSNDFFADAIDLGAVASARAEANGFASIEPAEQALGTGSVWWRWTAPSDGTYDLRVLGGYANGLAVYEGDRLEDLREIARVAADSRKVLALPALEGQEFAIAAESIRHAELLIDPTGDPYQQWVARFPELPAEDRSPDASPAGDGISNLAKYYFGLDPHRNAYAPGSLNSSRLPSYYFDRTGITVTYSFDHATLLGSSVGKFRDVLQRSEDGQNWTDVPAQYLRSHSETPEYDPWKRWQLPVEGRQAYFRVKISRAP